MINVQPGMLVMLSSRFHKNKQYQQSNVISSVPLRQINDQNSFTDVHFTTADVALIVSIRKHSIFTHNSMRYDVLILKSNKLGWIQSDFLDIT